MAREPATPATTKSAKRVLLVDDEAIVSKVIRRQLVALGLQVTEARDVEQALLCLETGEVFDLLFTDWSMPGLSVEILLERFRESLPEARIVVSSGLSPSEMSSDQSGWDALLCKPFSIEELKQVIDNLLG